MAGRTWCQYLLPPGVKEGAITSYKGTDDRWAHSLPRKPAERHAPHSPFGKNNHQLRPGWRKVSHVSGVEAKQDLVGQGMHREQENIHLGGSDRHSTPRHPSQPLQSWSTPFPRHPLGQVCRRQLRPDTTKTVERGHPGFHKPRATPMGRSGSGSKRNSIVGNSLAAQGLGLCISPSGVMGSIQVCHSMLG